MDPHSFPPGVWWAISILTAHKEGGEKVAEKPGPTSPVFEAFAIRRGGGAP